MYDSLLETALLETSRHSCQTANQSCVESEPVPSDRTFLVRQIVATIALVLGVLAVGTVRAAPGPQTLNVEATGVQIYDCRADAAGQLSWQFREPLATLTQGGKTVGRHFAGPSWQMADGSAIVGKVSSQSPGATSRDIALLKLDVLNHSGAGLLSKVVSVERLDTRGGVYAGACEHAGDLHVEPYSALYRFFSG